MLDVVLCIDKSGSMVDDIEAVQGASDAMLAALDGFATSSNISLQVGLVTYTRHDEPDWLWARPLSSDVDTVRDNIQAISVDDLAKGRTGNEDMYAAMAYAMDQKVGGKTMEPKMGWRDGAAKIMIPMGDEPPDDPDWEGRTLADIAEVAENLDPVHMYPLILPKSGPDFLNPTVSAMKEIAKATGGEITRVESAQALPDALVSTVKLAVRRHREEVWRKENPPYALFAITGILGGLAVLATLAAVVGQFRQRRRAAAAKATMAEQAPDPALTGQSSTRRPKDR
jgi:hypothetical protein